MPRRRSETTLRLSEPVKVCIGPTSTKISVLRVCCREYLHDHQSRPAAFLTGPDVFPPTACAIEAAPGEDERFVPVQELFYECASMDKAHILREIKRTAQENGGIALGSDRFESETGIRNSDWLGKFWAS